MRSTICRAFGIAAAALLLAASPASADGPGAQELFVNGTPKIGRCDVSGAKVSFNLSSLMGEPTVNGTYRWEGDASCKLHYSTVVFLTVHSSLVDLGGDVLLNPVVPEAGKWAFNVTGSPNWDGLLCSYVGLKRGSCVSPDTAKKIWASGAVTEVRFEWDRAAVEAEIAKEEREREEAEARRKREAEEAAKDAPKLTLRATKMGGSNERAPREIPTPETSTTSGGATGSSVATTGGTSSGTSYGTSSGTSTGTSAGAIGSGAAGLGAMGAALGSGGDDEGSSAFEGEDSWNTAALVTHLGLSLGTVLTIASMAGDRSFGWEHRSASDVLLGRSSPFRVISISFGNGLMHGRFAQGLDVYWRESGGMVGQIDELQGGPGALPSGPAEAATYLAPYASMTVRALVLRFDVGAGFSYWTSKVSVGAEELAVRTGLLHFGLGAQVGSGLLSPFVSARYQRLSQIDGDKSVALGTNHTSPDDASYDARSGDWSLLVGNTFDLHGLVASGDGETTYSPLVEAAVAVLSEERSFIERGSFYVTLGMKMQFSTPWSITDERSRSRVHKP